MKITEYTDKWIEALRSGEYPQTRGMLHRLEGEEGNPVGYCCLGVAADLMGELQPDGSIIDEGCVRRRYGTLLFKQLSMLGIDEEDMDRLTEANDYHEMSFERIAAELERAKTHGFIREPVDWDS